MKPMYEEVTGRSDDRTPNEQDMLRSIYTENHQYQVWVHREMKGNFLHKEDAKKAAAHIWEHKGYDTVRFRWESPVSNILLLEIQSPAGDRWMTSDTFIVQIDVKVYN